MRKTSVAVRWKTVARMSMAISAGTPDRYTGFPFEVERPVWRAGYCTEFECRGQPGTAGASEPAGRMDPGPGFAMRGEAGNASGTTRPRAPGSRGTRINTATEDAHAMTRA